MNSLIAPVSSKLRPRFPGLEFHYVVHYADTDDWRSVPEEGFASFEYRIHFGKGKIRSRDASPVRKQDKDSIWFYEMSERFSLSAVQVIRMFLCRLHVILRLGFEDADKYDQHLHSSNLVIGIDRVPANNKDDLQTQIIFAKRDKSPERDSKKTKK